jgi:hypothetical protein
VAARIAPGKVVRPAATIHKEKAKIYDDLCYDDL